MSEFDAYVALALHLKRAAILLLLLTVAGVAFLIGAGF